MDEVFKALADASRRELLDRLRAENGQTLGELCSRLAMTRQAVSKHLAILEAANLVATVRRGREKLHQRSPRHLVKTACRLQRRSTDLAKTKLHLQDGPR